MGSLMTFQNSHFTWLEELKRLWPRQRRLPRRMPPRQINLGLPPFLDNYEIYYLCLNWRCKRQGFYFLNQLCWVFASDYKIVIGKQSGVPSIESPPSVLIYHLIRGIRWTCIFFFSSLDVLHDIPPRTPYYSKKFSEVALLLFKKE